MTTEQQRPAAELTCTECGFPLAGDDLFCGNCGAPAAAGVPLETPVPPGPSRPAWPTSAAGRPPVNAGDGGPRAAGELGPAGAFFRHAAPRAAGRLSNPTRYLCAAAYLNPWYANWVIGELLVSRRAVAPSVDADVEPVIRHCLYARKIALIRDLVLTAVLIIGLVVATSATITVLLVALGLAFLRGPAWQRRSAGSKVAIGAGVLAVLFGVGVLIAIVTVISHFGQLFSAATAGQPTAPGPGIGLYVLAVLVFLVLTAAPVVIHTWVKYRTLSDRLRPGAGRMRFGPASPLMEDRVAQVEAAQWGNLTLYSGENPFVGAGNVTRAWSIAIELDRARPGGQGIAAAVRGPRGYVPIDPVELHQVIRDRLGRLNDPGLPQNERIAALTVEDHVVGEGLRSWESPLIDGALGIPYSQVDAEAIEAIIRHPQAGLRYYQRVSVSDQGQAVVSNGRTVLADADQEVAVSAFVYVAVEGRMFYLEFVTTVMPPILRHYHIIDGLPKLESGQLTAKVLQESASNMLTDLIGAPVHLYRTLRQMMQEASTFAKGPGNAADYIFSDIGARNSARGLGASRSPRTYIQTLDATKYTKIIERLLADTVLDFLAGKGVDTAAYAASASTIITGGSFAFAEKNFGAMAAGAGARATQAQGQQPPPPPTTT